jgi:hypothetical protein
MNNVKDPVELDRNPSRATTNSESSVYHDAEDFAFPGETFHPTGGFGSLPLSRTHSINQDHVMTSEEPVSSLPKESKTLSEKQVKDLAQALAERKRTGQNDETDMDFWSDRKQNGEIIKEDNDFDFRTIPYGGSELKPGHFEGPGVYGSEFHVPSTFAKQEPITRVRSNSSRSVSDDRGSSITSDSRTSSFNDNSLDSLPSTEPSSTGTSPFGSQHPSTDSLPNLSEPVTPPIDGLKVGGERKPGRLNMNRWEAMKNPKPAVTSSTPELFNQKPSATMGGPEDLGYDYRTRIEDIAHQVDQKHLTS